MFRRARSLVRWLLPYLPESDSVADVGSGTGHNAVTFRKQAECSLVQYDVTDIHWVGEAPHLFSADGQSAFLSSEQINCVLLIYVLQYPEHVESFLSRVLLSDAETFVVVQSTYQGRWGKCVFCIQEAVFGPIAFHLARLVRLIPWTQCPVTPRRYFTAEDLIELLTNCGLQVCEYDNRSNRLLGTGDELLVCRKGTE